MPFRTTLHRHLELPVLLLSLTVFALWCSLSDSNHRILSVLDSPSPGGPGRTLIWLGIVSLSAVLICYPTVTISLAVTILLVGLRLPWKFMTLSSFFF
ncbi:hypothetical protein BZA70DRAFT_285176 [Myxozyma melibiosi]|uniref:Uncharacterized protein n=1 Tax=Myxozyma melibiosi TaxID=54550 RepID=A0ABR1EZ37_9ASCO